MLLLRQTYTIKSSAKRLPLTQTKLQTIDRNRIIVAMQSCQRNYGLRGSERCKCSRPGIGTSPPVGTIANNVITRMTSSVEGGFPDISNAKPSARKYGLLRKCLICNSLSSLILWNHKKNPKEGGFMGYFSNVEIELPEAGSAPYLSYCRYTTQRTCEWQLF